MKKLFSAAPVAVMNVSAMGETGDIKADIFGMEPFFENN